MADTVRQFHQGCGVEMPAGLFRIGPHLIQVQLNKFGEVSRGPEQPVEAAVTRHRRHRRGKCRIAAGELTRHGLPPSDRH